jgi:hypothetical protein
MPRYEHGDASLYERGKPFISNEYETIICLRPSKDVEGDSWRAQHSERAIAGLYELGL